MNNPWVTIQHPCQPPTANRSLQEQGEPFAHLSVLWQLLKPKLCFVGALSEGPETSEQHWGITQPTGTRLHNLNKFPRCTWPLHWHRKAAHLLERYQPEVKIRLIWGYLEPLIWGKPDQFQTSSHCTATQCVLWEIIQNSVLQSATLWLWTVTANFNHTIGPAPSTSNSTGHKRPMKSFSDALSGFISFHVLSTINRKQAK